MDVGILGPLMVAVDGREVVIPAPKQRALLALLVLRRNQVVSVETLVDEIWGDESPSTATKIIHGYVSQLRKVLGDGRGRPPGRVAIDSPWRRRTSTRIDSKRCSRVGMPSARDGRAHASRGGSRCGARPLARGRAGGVPISWRSRRRARPVGRTPAARARVPPRGRDRRRQPRDGDTRVAAAGPRASAARVTAGLTDARAVPRRAAGGSTGGVFRYPKRPRRRARRRAE